MTEQFPDRCKTICGEDTPERLIANLKNIECMSDIIINKAWSAREIIEMGATRNRNNDLAEILDMAIDEMDDLIVWAQRMRAMRTNSGMGGDVVCRQ